MRVAYSVIAILLVSTTVPLGTLAGVIAPGDSVSTFDPYGYGDVEVSSEVDAVDDLRPKWMLSLGYTYTYRQNFPNAPNAVEQMSMWNVGVNFMPWTFLFAGVSLPAALSKREGGTINVYSVDGTEVSVRPYDWTGGLADLTTYLGSELPWVPLTITGMLMWPTGDIEKGMGTGEFSGGFTADLSLTFGKVRTKVGGYYFFLKNPTVRLDDENKEMDLPNTFGASVLASMRVGKTRMGLGFKWSYRTLVTWESVHVLEPTYKLVWPVNDWFAAVVNANVEVYPTFAFVPTLALVWSI